MQMPALAERAKTLSVSVTGLGFKGVATERLIRRLLVQAIDVLSRRSRTPPADPDPVTKETITHRGRIFLVRGLVR